MSNAADSVSRRLFLVRGMQAGAGLTVATLLPVPGAAVEYDATTAQVARGEGVNFNAFVAITPDNRVIVTIKHLEMGQGTYTGLATIVAEELDAAWEQVESVGAPANQEKYKRHDFLGVQLTAGSMSISTAWMQMRQAGATVRHMLVEAAARKWGVSRDDISTRDGVLQHQVSGRVASYGSLAEEAAALFGLGPTATAVPLPENIAVKNPADFRLIGRQGLARKDHGKTDGSAIYTIDVQMPDMLTALVARPPMFGGTVKSFDVSRARTIPGVAAVFEIPSGIAVLAKTFWQARKGRDALQVEWAAGENSHFSSDELFVDYRERSASPGVVAAEEGDVEAVLQNAATIVESDYEFPYLAHAPLEPINCVMQKRGNGVELWYGCQSHTFDQGNVARVLGIEVDQVTINTLYAGGSFGRRATFDSDVPTELAHIVKAYEPAVPIKLLYTREDDTRKGYYRPLVTHKLTAALGDDGKITALRDRVVSQSILGLPPDATDPSSVEEIPYAIPNRRVESHNTYLPVPPLFYRSVGATHNAFALETFVDEIAAKLGRDPVELRLELLADRPRYQAVLKQAAERAGWGGELPEGHFLGVALFALAGTVVANVAEIRRQPSGKYRLARVICAVDCGIAINPDIGAAADDRRHRFRAGADLF